MTAFDRVASAAAWRASSRARAWRASSARTEDSGRPDRCAAQPRNWVGGSRCSVEVLTGSRMSPVNDHDLGLPLNRQLRDATFDSLLCGGQLFRFQEEIDWIGTSAVRLVVIDFKLRRFVAPRLWRPGSSVQRFAVAVLPATGLRSVQVGDGRVVEKTMRFVPAKAANSGERRAIHAFGCGGDCWRWRELTVAGPRVKDRPNAKAIGSNAIKGSGNVKLICLAMVI